MFYTISQKPQNISCQENVKSENLKCRFDPFIQSLSHSLKFLPTSPFLYLSLLLLTSIVFCLFFFLYISFFSLILCASEHEVCVLWSECNSRIKRTCELWNISNKWACPQHYRILRNLQCSSTKVQKTSIEGAESTMHVQQMFDKVLKFLRFHLYSSFPLA